MTTFTDTGLKLEKLNNHIEAFSLIQSAKNHYTLHHNSGFEIVTTADKLSECQLPLTEMELLISDLDISRLDINAYREFRARLHKKLMNTFSKIYERSNEVLLNTCLFTLEAPEFIYWGHSIAGQRNICLGGLMEGWNRSELITKDEEGHDLFIICLGKGLSGYSVGKAYSPSSRSIIDISSPLLTSDHFYQLVDIRNRYSKVHDKSSLLRINKFIESLN